MRTKTIRTDLIYPELSYKIIGILFEVYNNLGPGYQEKYYQRAIGAAFREQKIDFKEQFLTAIKFKNNNIGKYFLDFLVDNKIVLEIKKGDRFSRRDIEQVYAYLKAMNLKLGIISNFTNKGIKFKRIIHLD
ncbi:GxxExxY protein [Patescibacteria group bacterium]|nr:GxxExxY protein [Patescibacteria group bacterium]MBU4481445.1 GxxExxY protein [Patescibacteria group bacterium]